MLGGKWAAAMVAAGLMILAASGAQADSPHIAKIQAAKRPGDTGASLVRPRRSRGAGRSRQRCAIPVSVRGLNGHAVGSAYEKVDLRHDFRARQF